MTKKAYLCPSMIDITRHIEYLLLSNNSVCVPQLGTFHIKDVASRWVTDESIFLPPYRIVEFEESADASDNTLQHSIATRYNVSLTDADIACAEFVERVRQELEDCGTSDLGSIGVLIRENNESEMLFIPSESGITTPSLYGLDAFHIAPLPMKIVVQQQEATRREEQAQRTDSKYFVIRIPKKLARYTAAAAAVVAIFFAVGTPVANSLNNDEAQQADASTLVQPIAAQPTQKETPKPVSPKKETPAPAEAKVVEATIADQAPAEEVSEAVVAETPAETPAVPTETPKATDKQEYALVLASDIAMRFAEANIEKLHKEGVAGAELRDFNGHMRIIVAGLDSEEAVFQLRAEIVAKTGKYQNAWPLAL